MQYVTTTATRVVFLVFFGMLAGDARAQITIDRGEIEELIDRSYLATTFTAADSAYFQALVNASGPDQTFDFTGTTYPLADTGRIAYMEPDAGTPGINDPAFASANIVVRATAAEDSVEFSAWAFERLDNDTLYQVGLLIPFGDIDEDGQPDTVKFYYEPALASSPLPYTYGDSWTASAMEVSSFMGIEESYPVRYAYEVDSYGTLITPHGSAPALRMRVLVEEQDPFAGDTLRYRMYNFVTREGLSASISTDENGVVESASYTVMEEDVISGTDPAAGLPEGYRLDQNYPNPFNPETTIAFELGRTEHVTLKVFDALGRGVATLVDGVKTAGAHHVRFQAGALPNGVYVYRLQGEGFSQTRTMLLMK